MPVTASAVGSTMAGQEGSYLIAWSQTCIEGLRSPPLASLETGASWSWSGHAVALARPTGECVDDSPDVFRRRAVRAVRQLLGDVLAPVRPVNGCGFGEVALDREFVVTCGRETYRVSLLHLSEAARPLLLFLGRQPPRDRLLRVVDGLYADARPLTPSHEPAGIICFTPGTLLSTPAGPRPVEALQEGDLLDTLDGGAQEILWIGRRRLTGAQMHAMPQLRPVRIRAGAFGLDVPVEDLLVSPRHRLLVRGPIAEALFGTPEVLVAAEDLVNDRSVTRDHSVREVSYIHLLLPRHHILRANGLETESFHPASTDLRTIDPAQFARLASIVPDVERNPRGYGEPVRRELSKSDARALRAEAASTH
jgi:hypothetical protein